MPLPRGDGDAFEQGRVVHIVGDDHVEAVVGPRDLAVEIVRFRHGLVVALEVSAQDGLVGGDVTCVRVRLRQTRVSALERDAALESKEARRSPASTFLPASGL